jgi:quercetin dioxygenase-like cupin family protein
LLGRRILLDAGRTVYSGTKEGSELVVCTDGEMTLVQEVEGQEIRTTLRAGEYAINDAGVWHTADVREHATALFVTAGMGTQIRAR